MELEIKDIDPNQDYILINNGRFMISSGQTFIELMQKTNSDKIFLLKYSEE